MKKIKNDLVSSKKGLPEKKVDSTEKSGKVDNLHPKAKNLTDNLKDQSGSSIKSGKKIGSVEHLPFSPKLKKK